MESNSKSIFLSKTFWGSILTVLVALFPHLGVDAEAVPQIAMSLATVAGAAFAIYGRVTAKTKVSLIKK